MTAPLLLVALALLCLSAGHRAGRAGEAAHWRLKADPAHRSAVCSAGRFFHVVPEAEYVRCRRRLDRPPEE